MTYHAEMGKDALMDIIAVLGGGVAHCDLRLLIVTLEKHVVQVAVVVVERVVTAVSVIGPCL